MEKIQETLRINCADDWPLMQSPIYPMIILGSYLYFVLKLGPQFMKNRPALDLSKTLLLYNGCQVLFSIWLVYKISSEDIDKLMLSIRNCVPRDSMKNTTSIYWWYFFGKVTELLDTVFFVLRKKQNQVTPLHIYHHSLMMVFTWMYTKYFQGGEGLFLGFINTIVHVVMYLYYFIAALGPKYQKYLWWKKSVTRIQLIQFAIGGMYVVNLIVRRCDVPKSIIIFYVVNDAVFIYLFIDFYIKAYKKKKLASETQQNK